MQPLTTLRQGAKHPELQSFYGSIFATRWQERPAALRRFFEEYTRSLAEADVAMLWDEQCHVRAARPHACRSGGGRGGSGGLHVRRLALATLGIGLRLAQPLLQISHLRRW